MTCRLGNTTSVHQCCAAGIQHKYVVFMQSFAELLQVCTYGFDCKSFTDIEEMKGTNDQVHVEDAPFVSYVPQNTFDLINGA